MTDLREKIARALCRAHCGEPCQYDCERTKAWALLLPDADAVLAVLRPSPRAKEVAAELRYFGKYGWASQMTATQMQLLREAAALLDPPQQ